MNARAVRTASLGAAAAGLVLLGVGLRVDPARTWFAYLEAWTFAVSLGIGALILLMAGHASKGSWMVVTRRPSEAVVSTLLPTALLFGPVAFGLRYLYPWAASPDSLDAATRSLVAHRHAYDNPPWFLARTGLYLAVFVTVGAFLRAWSSENDRRPRPALVLRMRRLSGGALPLVGLALTWASFDWTMGLEAPTASTIFGLYFFAGSFVGAIALVTLFVIARSHAPGASVTVEHRHAIGRLLFAMVAFWAYMAFSQLLIVWIADVPAEAEYYVRRTTGSWTFVTALLVVGMFVVPFFTLLGRTAKRRADVLAAVAAWVLVLHYVDVYWMILPVHDAAGAHPRWMDAGALLFVVGTVTAWAAARSEHRSPLPSHTPDLVDGLRYEAAP